MRTKKLIFNIIKNVFIWVVTLSTLIPLLLILNNSFKEKYQASSMGMDLPKSFHLENYGIVIESGKLIRSFFNSIMYSTVSVVIVIILTTMAAYVLSRNKSRFNRFIYFFITLGIAMPMNYVSLTKVMQATHLINTRMGISLLYAAIQIPFTVFLVYGFIGTVPRELDEAGVIDGCTPSRLFFSIIFPLLKPVIVTVAVLNFMNTWNDFINPLYYLNSAAKWPMTLAVYNFFGQFQVQWNLVSADIILTSLPVILIYLLGQRHIISGMTSGAVKG